MKKFVSALALAAVLSVSTSPASAGVLITSATGQPETPNTKGVLITSIFGHGLMGVLITSVAGVLITSATTPPAQSNGVLITSSK